MIEFASDGFPQLRIKGKGERSQYSEYKTRYSYLDARRWANKRGLTIRGPLKVYDTTPALIGGLFAEQGGRLLDYSRKVSTSCSSNANSKPTSPTQSQA